VQLLRLRHCPIVLCKVSLLYRQSSLLPLLLLLLLLGFCW
jgi:hypothetical protein